MPKRTVNLSRRLLPGLIALLGAGCGGGGPTFAEVEGTVRLNGKPIDKVMVEFHPEIGIEGPRSSGITDAKGHYALTAETGKARGAVVGKHRVLLRDTGFAPFLGQMTSRTPRVYSTVQYTPLRAEVKPGPRQTIDLDMTGEGFTAK
jgi:hypothetical protein